MNDELILIERITRGFEAALRSGSRPALTEYLHRVEAPLKQRLAAALIPLEIAHRLSAGEAVLADDYRQFGPECAAIAEDVLARSAAAAGSGEMAVTMQHEAQVSPEDRRAELPPASDNHPSRSARSIGPYKLLQRLGVGGMGEVWIAEQSEPVKRRVALKLVKAGVGSKEILARFEAERQALALMNHPNIARILDAGTTADGQPYFAMELVPGKPLTTWCDENRLSIDDRLRLFADVCNGVQHAHQKGIIHRDLKPGNILVTVADGKAVPKVIDFGLAKAMESTQRLTDQSLFTGIGQILGTLKYMSPEQASLDSIDIDTRTDIYALGVILYELLTGSTPLDDSSIKGQAALKILEFIRDKEPVKPSSKLGSSTAEQVSTITGQRKTDSVRLNRVLAGDLDWIVMKALEKDRTRRYESASGFAADIQRYLNSEPVIARPPTIRYRVRKIVQKRRGLVASLASIAALLVLGIISTTWFAFAANRARINSDEARGIADQKTAEANFALEQTNATLARSNYFLAIARWEANRAPEAIEILELVPPNYRRFEWHLARREFEGGYMTCYGHQSNVNSVSFSPNGAGIVSGSDDKTIKLWDAATGRELRTLKGHIGQVFSVSFSPDGAKIVSSSEDATLRIWEAATGKELRTLLAHASRVYSVGFSPDGAQIVSGSGDKTIKLWDAATGKELRTLQGHMDGVSSVGFSPDGAQIVSGSGDHTLKLWDATTGKELRTLQGHTEWVSSVAFSPDGNRIVSGSHDKTIKLWDAATGKELRTLRGNVFPVSSARFSPDGRWIVSGGYDRMVKLWDAATGLELRTFQGQDGRGARDIGFSPDSARIVSGSEDGTVKLWDVTSGQELHAFQGHSSSVTCVSFSPDGMQMVSGSRDQEIKIWDAATGQELHTLLGHMGGVSSVGFSPDGAQIVSGSADHTLKLWDAATGKELRTIPGHTGMVTSVAFSPDGTRIVSGSHDKTIKLWDAASGQGLHTLLGHTKSVHSVGFSPDGAQIVSGSSDHTLKLWDTATGREVRTLQGHAGLVLSVSFRSDGAQIVSASEDRTLKLWDAATGQELHTLRGHIGMVYKASFSPDGSRLVSTSEDATLRLWETATGQELRAIKENTASFSVNFSPIGNRLVSGSKDGTLKLWESAISQELRRLKGHAAKVNSCSFSPNGSRIVSASADQTLKVWDAATGQALRTLKGHTLPVYSGAFSPDGARIVSGCKGGTIRLWNAATGQVIHTLQGYSHTTWVIGVSFSSDGTRVYSTGSFGEKLVWNAQTGALLEDEPWRGDDQAKTVSNDGRWLLTSSDNDVLLVDREYSNRPFENTIRTLKARPKLYWHSEQAEACENNGQWYAATFHRAWAIRASFETAATNPSRHALCKQALNLTYDALLDLDDRENRRSARFLPSAVKEAIDLGSTVRIEDSEGVSSSRFVVLKNETQEGYSRLVYPKVRLLKGRYCFQCRFRRIPGFGWGDHVPGFWAMQDTDLAVVNPVSLNLGDDWIAFFCDVEIKTAGEFDLIIAMWKKAVVEFDDISFKSPDGQELLTNGNFAAGLEPWSAMGGRVELFDNER